MILEMLTVGTLSTNCYIVGCPEKLEALIIDPGFDRNSEADKVLKKADQHKLEVKFIVNTHGHPDHTAGNRILKETTGAPILIHEFDAPKLPNASKNLSMLFGLPVTSPPADQTLKEEDIIQAGKIKLKVLHTPGHSKGSISLLGEDAVFTGDTLFTGSIGRYDFPDSSFKEIMNSLKKLAMLPDQIKVYPGHGPTSTIGREKRSNPFLQM
ncbi:MAG: MBL fold metallo-hydrolase [Candidatus Bathyarchaeia archaeon]